MQLLVQSKFVVPAPEPRKQNRKDALEVVAVNGSVAGSCRNNVVRALELVTVQCAARSYDQKIPTCWTVASQDAVLVGRSGYGGIQCGSMLSCQELGIYRAANNVGSGRGDFVGFGHLFVKQPAEVKTGGKTHCVDLKSLNSEFSGRVDFARAGNRAAEGNVDWCRVQRVQLQIVNTHDAGVASEVLVSSPVPISPPTQIPVVMNKKVPSSPAPPVAQVRHPVAHSSVLPVQNPGLVGIPGSNVLVECFEITGGSSLSGHLKISGAKNSALAVLAGALCCKEPLSLRMIPDLHDIRRMFQVLQSTGARVRRVGSSIIVDASQLTSVEPCPEAVRKLRASFFVIGALVGRQGEAVVPLPGGCNIGARPIDLHVRGLEALGAHVKIRQGKVHACASNGRRLVGGSFHLDYPSVGATETLMMAASLADGSTILSNVAQEPEVVDLANFLISCGAIIHGAGTSTLHIKGVKDLHATDFTIIPDRIEAGTFLIAAAITRSSISMSPVVPHHLTAVMGKLRGIGCRVQQMAPDSLRISAAPHLRSSDVTTLPYPGFPTDLQPQLMSLLTTCIGQSLVEETVFESRMRHVEELQKLGAKVRVSRNMAYISGKDQGSSLYGAPVSATDLRAGAALVLAGMAAEGTTHIEGVSHIDRGYEQLDEKLRTLGADIRRLPCLPSEIERLPSLPVESPF